MFYIHRDISMKDSSSLSVLVVGWDLYSPVWWFMFSPGCQVRQYFFSIGHTTIILFSRSDLALADNFPFWPLQLLPSTLLLLPPLIVFFSFSVADRRSFARLIKKNRHHKDEHKYLWESGIRTWDKKVERLPRPTISAIVSCGTELCVNVPNNRNLLILIILHTTNPWKDFSNRRLLKHLVKCAPAKTKLT